MPSVLSPELTSEIANVPRRRLSEPVWGERISHHIARSEGFLESTSASWGPGVYALFEEMEDKDPHLFSILQTRRNGLLARPRKLEPASSAIEDVQVAEWLEGALARIPDWDRALAHLLDALGKGMAVVEVIWGHDSAGNVVPMGLRPRNAGRFSIESEGELVLNDASTPGASAYERLGAARDRNRSGLDLRPLSAGFGTRQLPEKKFLTLLFNASDERPYGKGLLERLFWYWWFKKNNLKFWVIYNEKFGSPTVVAKHDPTISASERERLLDVISSLQADAGVTIPEGIVLELLESKRSGSADTYREMADWCNDEMTRAVLGQTLTVGEGKRSGSLALAKVHEAVRFDYIRADACLLEGAINSQLIRWIVDFNYGPGFAAPRWKVDLSPEVDQEIEVGIDRQLLQMGVPLPLRYFYQKYGRPPVAEQERQLRYDDNNLFQYHLQFGVLTVNEVRSSLGLPPIEGGDRPTVPAEPPSSPLPPKGSAGATSAGGSRDLTREESLGSERAEEEGEADER